MSRTKEEREKFQTYNGWLEVDTYPCGCRLEGRGTEDAPVTIEWCAAHIYTEANLIEDGDSLWREVFARCVSRGVMVDITEAAVVASAVRQADVALAAWMARVEKLRGEAAEAWARLPPWGRLPK